MTTHKALKQSGACDCAEKSVLCSVLPICPQENFRIKICPEQKNGRALPLAGALTWIDDNLKQGANFKTLEIGGPGDPLATADLTVEMASKITSRYPEIHLRIATLGLHGYRYAHELANAGIKGVTMLVDAVDPEIAQKIYAWIRPATKTVPLNLATEILIDEQSLAVKAFKEAGLEVTIRTTVYPGYNDHHVEAIARAMASLGADAMTLVPTSGGNPKSGDGTVCQSKKSVMQQIREQACAHLPNVTIAHQEPSAIGSGCTSQAGKCVNLAAMLPGPSQGKPNVAVVSSNGMEIDLHLGQAYQVLIYGPREDGLPCLLGTRSVPEPGGGGSRWRDLAAEIHDCFALLAASAGESPRKILAQHGITVLIHAGEIEGAVDVLFGGGGSGKKKC